MGDNFSIETGYSTGIACPKCKSILLSDGVYMWCSNVGNENYRFGYACSYGLFDDIRLDEQERCSMQAEKQKQKELRRNKVHLYVIAGN